MRFEAVCHCGGTPPSSGHCTDAVQVLERGDLRLTRAVKRTLQQAAAVKNKILTEFLLNTGLTAAFDAIADRCVFHLDAKALARFHGHAFGAAEGQSTPAPLAYPQDERKS